MDKQKRMKLLSKKAEQTTNKSCTQCVAKKETSNATKAVLVPFHSAFDVVPEDFWEPELKGWLVPVCDNCYGVFEKGMNKASTPETRFGVISKWMTPLVKSQQQ